MAVVVLAAGPATTSSWWETPTRKRWTIPLCTPTDIRSGTRPTEVGMVAASLSAARISTAALAAWFGVVVPAEQQQECVAPELEQDPTAVVGQPEHRAEDPVEDVGQLLGADAAAASQPL